MPLFQTVSYAAVRLTTKAPAYIFRIVKVKMNFNFQVKSESESKMNFTFQQKSKNGLSIYKKKECFSQKFSLFTFEIMGAPESIRQQL